MTATKAQPLTMNCPFVAADVRRRIFREHNAIRLLTSAATNLRET